MALTLAPSASSDGNRIDVTSLPWSRRFTRPGVDAHADFARMSELELEIPGWARTSQDLIRPALEGPGAGVRNDCYLLDARHTSDYCRRTLKLETRRPYEVPPIRRVEVHYFLFLLCEIQPSSP